MTSDPVDLDARRHRAGPPTRSESIALGAFRTGRVEEIEEDEVPETAARYWSVTTILDVLDKPGLRYWFRNAAIDVLLDVYDGRNPAGAYQLRDGAERVETTSRKKVRSYVGSRMYRRDGERTATQLGIDVHDGLERWAIAGKRPGVDATVARYLDVVERDFFRAFRPTYEAAEMTVLHETWGYAGTLDAIVVIDGKRFVVDYKTSDVDVDDFGKNKGPYPEAALQIAAYRFAELSCWNAKRVTSGQRYYVIDDVARASAVPMPEIDGGLIVQVSPERARVHPVACGPDVHTYFGHVLELASWSFGASRSAVKPPLIPPTDAA